MTHNDRNTNRKSSLTWAGPGPVFAASGELSAVTDLARPVPLTTPVLVFCQRLGPDDRSRFVLVLRIPSRRLMVLG